MSKSSEPKFDPKIVEFPLNYSRSSTYGDISDELASLDREIDLELYSQSTDGHSHDLIEDLLSGVEIDHHYPQESWGDFKEEVYQIIQEDTQELLLKSIQEKMNTLRDLALRAKYYNSDLDGLLPEDDS